MPSLAIAPRSTTPPPLVRGFPIQTAATLVFFAALWFVLCRHLSGEWSVNEQYNFGWFVPFFALYLFWLRWQDRSAPEVRGRRSVVAWVIGVTALVVLLPVRLFEIANPESVSY